MRVLIVDDEQGARRDLRQLLTSHPALQIAGEAADVDEAREAIRHVRPDVVFLDIRMPGGSGFDLLESLDSVPEVIFTTAYDHHAVQAFEVSAVDYLLKPIDPERLAQAIERASERVSAYGRTSSRRVDASAGILSREHRVFLRDGDRCWLVPIRDIVLLEADEGYVRVHFRDQRPLLKRSLNQWEAKLDPTMFFRANRAQIVALDRVDEVHPWFGGRLLIKMEGGREITLSRRRAAEFQERMGVE